MRNTKKVIYILVISILVVFLIIYTFLFAKKILMRTDGTSMMPNVQDNSIVLLEPINCEKLKRGDIVVFSHSEWELVTVEKKEGEESTLDLKQSKAEYIMKRIVGLPGESVKVLDNVIYIDGKVLSEDYLPNKSFQKLQWDEIYELDESEFFMVGDNRVESYDSRYYGPVEGKQIVMKYVKTLVDFSIITNGLNEFRKKLDW